MLLLSYFVGQRKYPVAYDLRSALVYGSLAAALYAAGMCVPIESEWLRLGYRTLLLGLYVAFLLRRDLRGVIKGLRKR